MGLTKRIVKEYTREDSVFVCENDTIYDIFEKMKLFNVEDIPITNKESYLLGYINKTKLKRILKDRLKQNLSIIRNTQIKDLAYQYDYPIVLYPGMSLDEAYETMKCFKNKCLPVVEVPWKKKLIGFLWLEDISYTLKQRYFKIPV